MANQEKQSGGRKMERLFEEVFVEVCAPTLRGVKPSNLFRFASFWVKYLYSTF